MLFRSSTTFIAALFAVASAFAQTADFSADVLEGCLPLTVNFEDKSTGSPNKWEWDFGNNNGSTLQHPGAVFSEAGVYHISLTVSSGGAPSTRIRSAYIIVHDFPQTGFTLNTATGCAPFTVKFSDNTPATTGQITSWSWIFGDGGTSSAANPTYKFQQPGKKTVTLKAKNEFGCETTKTIVDAVNVLGPTTDFSVDHLSVCQLPATFTFTNKTTGDAPLTYQWTFGDTQSSIAQNPSHVYNIAGAYHVTLKARDGNNCESTKQITVYAGSDGGIDFTPSRAIVCVGEEIEFTTASVDPPVTSSWSFGDGSTSTNHNPKHKYTVPGTYTVTLDAALLNHACNALVTKTIIVAKPAVASFTRSIDCNYNLTLTSTSQNAFRLEWYIEDEQVSSAFSFKIDLKTAGQRMIKLIAFDQADCSHAIELPVEIEPGPLAAFKPDILQNCTVNENLSGCAPFSVQFVNQSSASTTLSYLWEFGDGQSSTDKDPPHIFTTKGLYQVTLTVTDTKGCKNVATKFVIVENTPPVADFIFDKTVACAGEEITFTDKSTNADFYCWDFGDLSKDSGKTVIHKYSEPGVYTITLTAKNAGCTHTKTIHQAITIKDPYVNFILSKQCIDPYTIGLVNKSTDFNTIQWDFGDGQTSTIYDVGNHTYAQEGKYTVSLTGTNNSTGCTTTALFPISIQKIKADFELSSTKPCKGSTLAMTDKSHAAVEWEWSVGSYGSKFQNTSTKVNTPGPYVAGLIVKDADGCSDVKLVPIQVVDIAGDFTFEATSNCSEFAVQFKDRTQSSPTPDSWLWDFGDGVTETDQHPTHTYTATGKYDVTLEVGNVNGTCTFVKVDAVNFTNPVPGFQTAKNFYCPGEPVIVANTTIDAVSYLWDYGDGRIADFETPVIIYPNVGTYDITLFAKDSYGCEKRITKLDVVTVAKPTARFSIKEDQAPCPPFIAAFEDESLGTVKEWAWTFGDGKSSILQDPTNTYLAAGDFTVDLTVKDENGCVDHKTSGQFVHVGGPSGSFSWTGDDQKCSNDEIEFSSDTRNTVTWRWDFGDGNVVETKVPAINHNYEDIGSYTPSLVLVDDRGCTLKSDNIPKAIIISDTTAVSFALSARCIHPEEKFKLTGEIKDGIKWSWVIDGQETYNGTSVEVSVDEPGMHRILGLAANKANCISRIVDTVHVQGKVDVVPNVITPNGDSFNESFTFSGLENSQWNIDIVNRWGSSVFREMDYKGSWTGSGQPEGVYFYVLKNALCPEAGYRGYITLTR